MEEPMAATCTQSLFLDGCVFRYYDIVRYAGPGIIQVPYSLRILLENMLRHFDGTSVDEAMLEAVADRTGTSVRPSEVPFHPARILMQDFTGVPAVVDLASLRDAAAQAGKDPEIINPQVPVDLIVDHSVQIDSYGRSDSLDTNVGLEYERNRERYGFLTWAQKNFSNFRIVPPNSGICHQVNLEHLAEVVRVEQGFLFPDTVIGTDSHTTMINALGVMGWGVGGIEAEAVMLGQPCFIPIPRIVGVRLLGAMDPACTATDLVLTLTQLLRKKGVVGSFVEYFGPGLAALDIPDRATIANMSPEYGATMGFFPVDERTIAYLRLTGRDKDAKLTDVYCRTNALFHDPSTEAAYDEVVELDLASVVPCVAGPSRPQDRIPLAKARDTICAASALDVQRSATIDLDGTETVLPDGAVVIAAITSCTNTSNPAVMIAAGLLARNAARKGLKPMPWVKTSLAPGSRVVVDYLKASGLLADLERVGFYVAAFGCTTCIGNSGPLHPAIEQARPERDITLAAVLSGNRNFAGRIHPRVKASFLMSPPLVVAYALAGRIGIDFSREPLGLDEQGEKVFLRDVWPRTQEIEHLVSLHVTRESFAKRYAGVFTGDRRWEALEAPDGKRFPWDAKSTYIAKAPFFTDFPAVPPPIQPIQGARVLLMMGDSVTTDHISPAGFIDPSYPAGIYLSSLGIPVDNFNSYGSRRGNHEVMVRGMFANTRIKQILSAPREGGFTRKFPEGTLMHVYDAAMAYQKEGTDLIILAGKEYGTGSSRDWAAKGTSLLGVRAVLAESFERIHRSNLVGMGVLPLVYGGEASSKKLGLDGTERYFLDLPEVIGPRETLTMRVERADGTLAEFPVVCRLDSPAEITYFRHKGILQYALRHMLYHL